jgi:hypothetical protein
MTTAITMAVWLGMISMEIPKAGRTMVKTATRDERHG